MVFHHFNLMLSNINDLQPQYLLLINENMGIVSNFIDSIKESRETLSRYVKALNEIKEQHIWWDIVAHPKLEELWRN
jgi:predicted glycosyltransferase